MEGSLEEWSTAKSKKSKQGNKKAKHPKKNANNSAKTKEVNNFAENLGTVLYETVENLFLLKQADQQLLRSAVLRWNATDETEVGLENAKYWELKTIQIPKCDLSSISIKNKTKTFKATLSYRPFREETTRYRLNNDAFGWHSQKRIIAQKFGVLVSVIHVYVNSEGIPLGIGVFIKGIARSLNVEIIFPAGEDVEMDEIRSFYGKSFRSLANKDYEGILQTTHSEEYDDILMQRNILYYIGMKMMRGYALDQRGDSQGAINVYEEIQLKGMGHLEGFKTSFPATILTIFLSEAESKIGPGGQEAQAELICYYGVCEQASKQDEECMVCFENIPSATMIPCEHKICPRCAALHFRKYCKTFCPMCVQNVTAIRIDGNMYLITKD